MNSHEVFIHIRQGCFAGTGAIIRLPQCPWSKPDGYGKISQCITTTKHSKAKTVCIFLWIYCNDIDRDIIEHSVPWWNNLLPLVPNCSEMVTMVATSGRYGCAILMSYTEVNKSLKQLLLTYNLCISVTWPLTCAFHIPCTHTPGIIDMHRGVCDDWVD